MSDVVAFLLLPALMTVAAAALCWRSVTRPWLFSAMSFLSLGGLQVMARELAFQATFAANHVLVSLDSAPDSFSYQLAAATLDRHFLIMSALVVAFGAPLLAWLRKGLRRP